MIFMFFWCFMMHWIILLNDLTIINLFFRFLFYTMMNEISEKSHFSSVICDSNDNKLHIAFSSSYDDCSNFYFQLLSSVIYTCINILCYYIQHYEKRLRTDVLEWFRIKEEFHCLFLFPKIFHFENFWK